MHLVCLQENLKHALNVTERIIGRNLTLPILNNLLLSVENNKLKIASTNLEIGINHWTTGKIENKGTITVPARLLSDFVNNLPNKKIELKTKNNNLELKCEKFKANLKGLNAAEFPIIPKIKNKALIKIKGVLLRNGLAQVAGMAALSESRPSISGVYMKIDKNSIKLAATDSFRLAEKTLELDNSAWLDKEAPEQAVIIPQRTAQELIRILGEKAPGSEDKGQEIMIVLSGNQILFELGSTQIVSRLIEDQYPDYQQVIPTDLSTQFCSNKQELINNIKIASLFSGKVNDVKIGVDSKNSTVQLFSKDADIGENKSQLKAETKGKEMEAVFNYRYILDGLANVFSDKVLVGFDESNKAIIRPVNDDSYAYVVMPIKS